jgi:hypothetical protein
MRLSSRNRARSYVGVALGNIARSDFQQFHPFSSA